MKKSIFLIVIVVVAMLLGGFKPEPEWKSLFNGKNLDGWTVRGKATWVVKDGVLVGEGENGHIYAAPERQPEKPQPIQPKTASGSITALK
jgi:hypothetical protein